MEKTNNLDIFSRQIAANENFGIYYSELLRQDRQASVPLFDLRFQKNQQFTGREEQLNQISDYLNQQNTLAITSTDILKVSA